MCAVHAIIGYIGTVHGTVLNGLTRWIESRYFYVSLSNFTVYIFYTEIDLMRG